MGRHALAAALLCASSAAWAGDVEGTLRIRAPGSEATSAPGPQGVVVYLTGFTQPAPAETPVIAQKDKTFVPNLRVVVAGQSVRFTNDDQVVHNVFSTSKARTFDLGKPGPGQAREVRFPTPGLVEIYCNIHEAMWATVLVLPNRSWAFVDAQGHFVLHDVPPGRYPLYAWGHEIEPFQSEVVVSATQPAHVELTVNARAFSPAHLDKYGRPYRPRPGYSP